MISEKQLAEFFDSFWQHHFPLLNPTFVRRFNAERKERLEDSNANPVLPVPMGAEVDRFDLAAEFAFELAIENFRARSGELADRSSAVERALRRISLLRGGVELGTLSVAEEQEADALAEVYEVFFDSIGDASAISFRPRIRGVGVLDGMEGDFCSPDTLFEVKAVNRNLQSSDLRQVLVYLVAGNASRDFHWTNYCIFNPRLAVSYSGRVDELLSYLSGRIPSDCIAEVVEALSEREQPIESRF